MTAAHELPIDDFDVISPSIFSQHGYPEEQWRRLRAEAPVHFYPESVIPFWAITKHAHVTEIGRNPDTFLSGPKLVVNPNMVEDENADFVRPKTLIELDNPAHRVARKLISSRFTPRALKKIHADVDRIAKQIVDDLLDVEAGEVDFVEKVSAPLPIAVIAWLLGVPESDWNLIFDWTNRMIGFEDPEYGDQEGGQTALVELFTYFAKLVEEKQRKPADDLITVFTQAEVDGKKLEMMDILAWCQIIMVAGNETTRNATTGGMLALIQHQEELRRLQRQPELLKSGIEEMLRWTSPIIHFCRTAARDVDFHGQRIREGDHMALFYPSANRDEDVFEDPYSFRIDRSPNRHIAFGVGEHFCAGAHVARLELEMAFRYLLPRLEEVELAGPVERLNSNLIGGIKHLPIRYKLT
jgi:cholest-4-en-3-one 26-monooxygenase